MKRKCKQCGKEFAAKLGEINRGGGIYCSTKCFYTSRRGKKRVFTEEWRQNLSNAGKGRKLSEEHKEKIGKSLRGKRQPWTSERNKKARGEDSPVWKGGISPKNARIRQSQEYQRWRKAIYKRDKHTCQACGDKEGELHAHHIKPFSEYVNLRTDLKNGITLCKKCHRKAHED